MNSQSFAPDAVLQFWFLESTAEDWWGASAAFDARLSERFAATHARVSHGEGFEWRHSAGGRLAEIIVLDQFSRQLYRGSPKAFAWDGMALVLAQEAVAGGFDAALPPQQRGFLYMPYMHAESARVQAAGLPLFQALEVPEMAAAANDHAEVIRRFGRFPKRNAALGRSSTAAESAYLAEVGDRMF